MKVGIIGAGITGLTAACELLKSGHEVVVIESDEQLGGLAGVVKLEEKYVERYYHHFFKTDTELISLLDELELSDKIFWLESQIGYYHGENIYKFGKPTDLLKFKPLNWLDKFKFGFSVFYLQKKRTWKDLDDISIGDWFKKYCAVEVYETIWEPLLKAKFGDDHKNIAASWLWGRIHPRSRSRDKIYENERLGYISGSFNLLFERLRERIVDLGGEIYLGTKVDLVDPLSDNQIKLVSGDININFDKVIATIPIPEFLKLVPSLSVSYNQKLKTIRYQAVICMIFILNSPLSDNVYWLNINSKYLPFGGIIEHTNFVPSDEYGGKKIVYVFNYLPANDPMCHYSKDEIQALYVNGLKKIFPLFNEGWVEDTVFSKDLFGTPIYSLDYASEMPSHKTPIPNLYLANTAQIYPEDRNVNNCIRNALFLTHMIKDEEKG